MTGGPHPARSTLLRLAQGGLEGEAADALRAHLSSCAPCRQAFHALEEATDAGGRPSTTVSAARVVSRDPRPGELLDRYVLGEPLGQGGMGRVYRARHAATGQAVAIKVVLQDFADNAEALRRAVNEARAVNAVHHPAIVRILDFGALPDGRPYLVTELLAGTSLAQLIAERGRLQLSEAIPLLAQVMAGVEAAHAVGVIHRDLKPENIFVDTSQEPWRATLLDFGLALHLTSGATRLTQSGTAVGTPAFMAPEQFQGAPEAATPRLDVYAMGMVAYAMLAGKPPFGDGAAAQVMYRHVHSSVPPLGEVVPGVPPALEALVARMVEKDAGARPTAAEVRAELEAMAAGSLGAARPRAARVAPIAAVVVSSFAIGAAAILQLLPGEEPPPEEPQRLEPSMRPLSPARAEPKPEPELDAGAVAADPPTEPAPIAFRGEQWPCRKLVDATAVVQEALGSTSFFQLRFDGEPPLLVYAERSALAALQRSRKRLLGCRGRWQLVQASRTEPLGLWATASGPILAGGLKAPLDSVEVVDAPPGARAQLWRCSDVLTVGPVYETAIGPWRIFQVTFADRGSLVVVSEWEDKARATSQLEALRVALRACQGGPNHVVAENAATGNVWGTRSGALISGGLKAMAADVSVRTLP